MNILCYRYGSIVEPDIIDGFKELGNQVSEICLEIYNKNTTPLEGLTALKDELMRHSYDFVFSINFYPFIAEVCNIFQIRYLCLTVDAPVLELFSNSIRLPWNRIFLFDRAQYEDFHPQNPECIFHLPLAGNPARYAPVIRNATPDLIQKYSADISFVGSLYTEKCPYDRLQTEDAYLKGYLEGIMDAQMQLPGCYLLEELLPDIIVDSFRDAMPQFYIPPENSRRDDRAVAAQYYLCPKISSTERISIMRSLGSRYQVCLYTGSDTTGLPVRNCGRVKTHTQMPLVFANSKINLNITSRSIRTGLPLRIFDVLACGGFLLTNAQSELPDCFSVGEDLDCFSCEDDLLAKVEYYLSHDKDRAEIAHNGFEKVQKYHTYPERLLQMIALAYGLS